MAAAASRSSSAPASHGASRPPRNAARRDAAGCATGSPSASGGGGAAVNASTNQRSPQLEQRTLRPLAPSDAGGIRNRVWQAGQVMIIASLAVGQRLAALCS